MLACGLALSLINLIITVYFFDTATLTTHHEHRPKKLDDDSMHDAPSSLSSQRRAYINGRAIHVNKGEEDGISACLLVNDENPRLPEWLAYHYTTLPLRHLIIAVDPASRSNPRSILDKWYNETGLQSQLWSDEQYLPSPKMRGPCPFREDEKKDAAKACLEHHRNRQQHFVIKCMAEFKRMNMSWVLLTDVDEYIALNQIREDDPAPSIDYETMQEEEEGVPIILLSDWRYHSADSKSSSHSNSKEAENDNGVTIGIIDGTVDGKYTKTSYIFTKRHESIGYGRIVEDSNRKKYFLRDDIAYYEATALHQAPGGTPTLKACHFFGTGTGTSLYANIYNDTYDTNYKDGQFVPIPMDWKSGDIKMRTFYGGHIITDVNGRRYYIENEHAFWPPHYRAQDSMAARAKLPSIGDAHTTILDVLKSQAKEEYTGGALGPCITMPRVLYGSREDDRKNNTMVSPHHDGFYEKMFVTLRYRWHASKGQFDESKYGKTLIDVSRIPQEHLRGEAYNIHRPLIYYCRKDPQPYSQSLFRVVSSVWFYWSCVLCLILLTCFSLFSDSWYTHSIQNHYLDSFEAYSYRNDVRSRQRQCKEVRSFMDVYVEFTSPILTRSDNITHMQSATKRKAKVQQLQQTMIFILGYRDL